MIYLVKSSVTVRETVIVVSQTVTLLSYFRVVTALLRCLVLYVVDAQGLLAIDYV
jgi:hypothetical protein